MASFLLFEVKKGFPALVIWHDLMKLHEILARRGGEGKGSCCAVTNCTNVNWVTSTNGLEFPNFRHSCTKTVILNTDITEGDGAFF